MFSFPTATEHMGTALSACTLSEAATGGSLKKGVLKNFEKFPRKLFLQKIPNNCFFLLLNSDNLLTSQQKIDLCYKKIHSKFINLVNQSTQITQKVD